MCGTPFWCRKKQSHVTAHCSPLLSLFIYFLETADNSKLICLSTQLDIIWWKVRWIDNYIDGKRSHKHRKLLHIKLFPIRCPNLMSVSTLWQWLLCIYSHISYPLIIQMQPFYFMKIYAYNYTWYQLLPDLFKHKNKMYCVTVEVLWNGL